MNKIDQYDLRDILETEIRHVAKLMLDLFSDATGWAISLYDNSGDGIWSSSEDLLSPLCRYCKSNDKLWKLCEEDHKKRSCISNYSNGYNEKLDICHIGLINLCHPIVSNGNFYGSILTGQKKLLNEDGTIENCHFFKKINTLLSTNYITEKEYVELIESFEKVDDVSEFPVELFKKIVKIEESINNIINDVVSRVEKRIKRLTLLRHELHDPNISIHNKLLYCNRQLKFIFENYEIDGEAIVHLQEIDNLIKYSRNWSYMFSVLIENISASMNREKTVPVFNRNNILYIIEKVISLFEENANRKEVYFDNVDFQYVQNKFIEIDKTLITRAFINIYNNAVKYSYFGQKDISTRTIKTLISDKNNKYLKIEIINFGTGILKSELESGSVWKEGVRGLLSSDRHRTGSGLGLPQIKKIIESHNGRVFIKSTPVSHDLIAGPYLTSVNVFLPYIYDKNFIGNHDEAYFMA